MSSAREAERDADGSAALAAILATQGSLLNSGLAIGTERAMVIDTGGGPRQGSEILDAVREKTALPLDVVNTHAHFFGNAVLAEVGITEFWGPRENAPPGSRRTVTPSAVD